VYSPRPTQKIVLQIDSVIRIPHLLNNEHNWLWSAQLGHFAADVGGAREHYTFAKNIDMMQVFVCRSVTPSSIIQQLEQSMKQGRLRTNSHFAPKYRSNGESCELYGSF
jgi:hypothetical protein